MCGLCAVGLKQEKKCIRCHKDKDLSEFYRNERYKKDGHSNVCKECHRAVYRSPYKDFD